MDSYIKLVVYCEYIKYSINHLKVRHPHVYAMFS